MKCGTLLSLHRKIKFKTELHFKFELRTYENRIYFKQVRMTRNIFTSIFILHRVTKYILDYTFQNQISQTCR
jgi:hypothetical protein